MNLSAAPYYIHDRNNISPRIIVSQPITTGRVRPITVNNMSTPIISEHHQDPASPSAPAQLSFADDLSLENTIKISSRVSSHMEGIVIRTTDHHRQYLVHQLDDECSSKKSNNDINGDEFQQQQFTATSLSSPVLVLSESNDGKLKYHYETLV